MRLKAILVGMCLLSSPQAALASTEAAGKLLSAKAIKAFNAPGAKLVSAKHWCEASIERSVSAVDRPGILNACVVASEDAFLQAVVSRVEAAVEAAHKAERTPENILRGVLLTPPDLGIADERLRRKADEAYLDGVSDIRDQIMDEVVDIAEVALSGDKLDAGVDLVMRNFCNKAWGPDDHFNKTFREQCGEGIKALKQRACKAAVEVTNKAKLGYSTIMMANGREGPLMVDLDRLVCAAASDGFEVKFVTDGWFWKDYYLTVTSNVSDTDGIVIQLHQERHEGSKVWIAEGISGARKPFDSAGATLACLQTSAEQGGMNAALQGIAGFFALKDGGFDHHDMVGKAFDSGSCLMWKDYWHRGQDMPNVKETIMDGLLGGLMGFKKP